VDASLFAHLTCQLHIPLPISPLKCLIEKHDVLVEYEKRVASILKDKNSSFTFDNTQSNNPSTSWNEPKTTKTSQPKTEEEKAQDRSSILFALGGIGTMMTYIGVKYFLVRDNS